MSIVGPSLFSLVFVVLGGAILAYARRSSNKAQQSVSWPTTEGEIAHSALLLQSAGSGTDDRAVTYKADVSYRYKVDGANFSSSRITLMDFASSPGRAQSIVQRYPDKSSVRVYYNPANFSESVLEPGAAGGINLLYLVGAIVAVGGIFFLLMSLTGRVHMSA